MVVNKLAVTTAMSVSGIDKPSPVSTSNTDGTFGRNKGSYFQYASWNIIAPALLSQSYYWQTKRYPVIYSQF
jgi:hypothetical protein